MPVGMSAYSGSTCYSNGNYYRVGHSPGTLREHAVWSFNVNDGALSTITMLNIHYSWNNTDAGEGWSGGFTYRVTLMAADNTTVLASATVTLSGATGSGDISLAGFSAPSNAVGFIHWYQDGSTYSTLKAFHKTGQVINYYDGSSANSPPYWNAGASVTLSESSPMPSSTTAVHVNWTPAADAQSEGIYYDVYRYTSINGVKKIASGITACDIWDTTFTSDENSVGPGYTMRYDVYCHDAVAFAGTHLVSANLTRNVAPTWNAGSVSANGLTTDSIFVESTTELYITWPALNTNDSGQAAYYTIKRIWPSVVLLAVNQTALFITDYVGSGNPGAAYKYEITASDGIEWNPTTLTSATFTKNSLTSAPLASTASVIFGSSGIAFTWTPASNTNGNGDFGYRINSWTLPIQNQSNNVASPFTLPIWRTGDAPIASTIPYVNFDDIKAYFAQYSYVGSSIFTLTTSNAYGSTGFTTKAISFDLRQYPSAITTVTPSGTFTIQGAEYYIPDRKAIALNWTAAVDPLGTAITYTVEVSLNGQAYYSITPTPLTTNSSAFAFNQVGGATTCVFRVIAKTSYGYTSSNLSAQITLHYYNPPTIFISSVTRNELSVVVVGVTAGNSSITNAKTITSRTITGKNGVPTATPNWPTVTDPNLLATDSYTLVLTVQDQGGVAVGTAAQTISTSIQAYVPLVSIREKGVGINAVNDAVGGFIIKMKGAINSVTDILGKAGFYENGRKVSVPSTAYSWHNGVLVDLGADNVWARMFTVKIWGNGYADGIPVDTIACAYYYQPGYVWVAPQQLNSGSQLAAVRFFTDGGRVKCWFIQAGASQTLNIECSDNQIGNFAPKSITHVAEPVGTNKVLCDVRLTPNAHMLDGYHAESFSQVGHGHAVVDTANALNAPDGTRLSSDKTPTGTAFKVRYDFVDAHQIGSPGSNYGGLMTYSPYTGKAADGGDASYQLGFGGTHPSASGWPKLNFRHGIDSNWGTWYNVLTAADFIFLDISAYFTAAGENISQNVTYTHNLGFVPRAVFFSMASVQNGMVFNYHRSLSSTNSIYFGVIKCDDPLTAGWYAMSLFMVR